jgi:hypothetical protein
LAQAAAEAATAVVTFISYLIIVTVMQSFTTITIIKLVFYTTFITNYCIQMFATPLSWNLGVVAARDLENCRISVCFGPLE